MKKTLINILIVLIIFLLSFLTYLKTQNIIICFNKIEKIFINESQIKKETDNLTENIYEAEMLNSKKVNTIKIFYTNKKNKIYKSTLKTLKKDKFINIYSLKDKKNYKIRTLPLDFPKYKLKKEKGYTEGFLFSSLRSPLWNFESQSVFPDLVKAKFSPYSFAFIIDLKNDDIIFYCKSRSNITNLQKHITKSGKTLYSYNIEIDYSNKSFCPMCYSKGILLNDNFEKIKEIKSIPNTNVDPHFLHIIDDNYYIINTYGGQISYLPSFKQEKECIFNIIQEIKDDKLLFKHSLQMFYDKFDYYNLWNTKEKETADITHVNSLIIDPKDNNLIISCGTISSIIKVERNTGKILWILGGKGDQFGLSPSEKPIMQHSLSLSNDGYLTLLNNNSTYWLNEEHYKDFHPGKSEILQFKLDEENFQITGFRKYSINEKIIAQGSVYNIANNRFIVAYGTEAADNNSKGLIISELDVGENKTYMQITLPVGSKYDCYNAHIYKTLD